MSRVIATRRSVFMVPVGLFFAAGLAGCQGLSNAVAKLPQWAEDAQTIGNALGTVAGVVGTIQGIPATVVSTVQNAVSTAQRFAAQIGSAASSAGSNVAGLVSSFSGAVAGAISSLAGVSVPPWVSTALSAVTTLMPTILSVAGVVLAGPSAPSDPRAIPAARAYLAALAG